MGGGVACASALSAPTGTTTTKRATAIARLATLTKAAARAAGDGGEVGDMAESGGKGAGHRQYRCRRFPLHTYRYVGVPTATALVWHSSLTCSTRRPVR